MTDLTITKNDQQKKSGPTLAQSEALMRLRREVQGGTIETTDPVVSDPRVNDGRPTNIPDDVSPEKVIKNEGRNPDTGAQLPSFTTRQEAQEKQIREPDVSERTNTSFSEAVGVTLRLENNPTVIKDIDGAPVKFGINQRANPDINVSKLTEEDAKRIYRERYWDAIGADNLDPEMRLLAFDTAVVHGTSVALEFIDRANGNPDKFASLAEQRFRRLAQQNPSKFRPVLKGWLNRLNTLERETMGVGLKNGRQQIAQITSQRTTPTFENDDLGAEYQRHREQTSRENTLSRLSRFAGQDTDIPVGAATTGPAPAQGDLSTAQRVFDNIVETPRAIAHGALSAGQELLDTLGQVASAVVPDDLEEIMKRTVITADGVQTLAPDELGAEESPSGIFIKDMVDEPETGLGLAVRDISQFLVGFVPIFKATKAIPSVGKSVVARSVVAGSIADPLVFDEQYGRLSNLIQDSEEKFGFDLTNPVTEFLAADPDDGFALSKLKQSLEGAGLGVLAEGLVGSLRLIKSVRNFGGAKKTPEAIQEELRLAPGGLEGGELSAEQVNRIRGNDGFLIKIDKNTREAAEAFRKEEFVIDGSTELAAVNALAKKPRKELEVLATKHKIDFKKSDTNGSLAEKIFEATKPPAKVANLNIPRITDDASLNEVIARTAKLFEEEFDTSVRSFEVVKDAAETIGKDPRRTFDLLNKSGTFSDAEIVAIKFLLRDSAKRIKQMLPKVKSAEASEVDLFEFQRAVAFHNALLQKLSGAAKEAGRALGAFRIAAEGTREFDLAIRQALEDSGGPQNARLFAEILDTATDEQMLNIAVRKGRAAKSSDMLIESFLSVLLTNPVTQSVNMLGNASTVGLAIPERWLASTFRSLAGGAGVESGEALMMSYAIPQGIKEGVRIAGRALADENVSDLFSKIEQRRSQAITAQNFRETIPGSALSKVTGGSLEEGGLLAKSIDYLGQGVRLPFRALTAGDLFFKSLSYRMEIHAQAFRKATQEGLKGEALGRRMAEIIREGDEGVRLAGQEAALDRTFTKPLGKIGGNLQKVFNEHPVLKIHVPFFRTPTNLVKFAGSRTPFALMAPSIRGDILAGGAKADMALAKITLGSLIGASVADTARQPIPKEGFEGVPYMTMITGGGPRDSGLRNELKAMGWQPYSVWNNSKGEYEAFIRMDPLAFIMGLSADAAEIIGQSDDADADEIAMAITASIAENVTSKTWMTGIASVLEIVAGGGPDELTLSRAKRHGLNLVGAVVPSGVAQLARMNDPTLRAADDVIQKIKSRVPGYTDEVPPRVNIMGEPILLHGGFGPDIISPFYRSPLKGTEAQVTQNEDGTFDAVVEGEVIATGASAAEARWNSVLSSTETSRELLANKIPIQFPDKQISGVELSQLEFNRYVKLAHNGIKDPSTGLTFWETVAALANGRHPDSFSYQTATPGPEGGKAMIVNRYLNGFREAARIQMRIESPVLDEKIRQVIKEQQEKLTGVR